MGLHFDRVSITNTNVSTSCQERSTSASSLNAYDSVFGYLRWYVMPSCQSFFFFYICKNLLYCHVVIVVGVCHPMYHTSTPMTSNFLPSSLNGSLPNVGQVSEMPLSSESSSQRP
ncbi:hypothetical protein MRB53_040999 [Persea americana]|nr:hypothetical protein MRB53_040999 [Persea americana]